MKDERKHSTARRGGALNSKVQRVTQKPCVSTKYTLPKRPSATLSKLSQESLFKVAESAAAGLHMKLKKKRPIEA
jgi:hypothetical protein